MLLASLTGCARLHKIIHPAAKVDQGKIPGSLAPYSGPIAYIAVADLEVNAAKATSEAGLGLREMLVNGLLSSGRFSIIDRHALSALIQGQEGPPAEGSSQLAASEQKTSPKAADLIITASVAEFEPQSSGGSSGVGGGGGVGSGAMGGLLSAAINKAYIALDIRIVDISTSKIIAATRIQGQASDITGMPGTPDNQLLNTGLSAYANTPMQKAIHICIGETVRYISGATPESYFKY